MVPVRGRCGRGGCVLGLGSGCRAGCSGVSVEEPPAIEDERVVLVDALDVLSSAFGVAS